MATPGHTDHDLSVRHIPSNRIYVADLMVIVKGRYLPPFPVFYPEQYRQSVAKIFNYQPKTLWLAHKGEVSLSEQDKQNFELSLPSQPITHRLAIKYKLQQVFKLIFNRD